MIVAFGRCLLLFLVFSHAVAVGGGGGGAGLSCRQMSRLKAGLAATMGVTFIDLWLQLEAWQVLGGGCGWWAGLRNLRKTYYSLCQCERVCEFNQCTVQLVAIYTDKATKI